MSPCTKRDSVPSIRSAITTLAPRRIPQSGRSLLSFRIDLIGRALRDASVHSDTVSRRKRCVLDGGGTVIREKPADASIDAGMGRRLW